MKKNYEILHRLTTIKEVGRDTADRDCWHAAIAAMHGILCAPIVEGVDPNPSQEAVAKWAVMQADKLVKLLKEK